MDSQKALTTSAQKKSQEARKNKKNSDITKKVSTSLEGAATLSDIDALLTHVVASDSDIHFVLAGTKIKPLGGAKVIIDPQDGVIIELREIKVEEG